MRVAGPRTPTLGPRRGSQFVTTDAQRDWPKRAVAWVERSCAEQGVPVKLSDPPAAGRSAPPLFALRDDEDDPARGGPEPTFGLSPPPVSEGTWEEPGH